MTESAAPATAPPCPLAALLPLWQDHLLAQRGLSQQTVLSYSQDLENFFLFRQELSGGGSMGVQPDEQEVFLYLAWLRARQNTGRTLARRLSALRAFFDFAMQEGVIKTNPAQLMDNPKLPQHLPEVLTRDEMEKMLSQPDMRERGGQRDRCMLELLYAAGLRVSELVGLQLTDLKLQPCSSILIHGKGRKERCLPLWKQTAKALRAWLEVRGAVSGVCLFVNARGEAMTRSGFEYILDKHVKVAAATCSSLSHKRISPHVLRHTTAMHLLQSGVPFNVIALWLGHESVTTTHRYVEADLAMKEKALARLEAPDTRIRRYQAPDSLMRFLNTL